MELAAPRVTFAIRRVEGPGPAVSPRRPGNNSETSAQAVDAAKTAVGTVPPAREPGPTARGSGTGELLPRPRHGGHGITAHPVGSASCKPYGVARHGTQGVGL